MLTSVFPAIPGEGVVELPGLMSVGQLFSHKVSQSVEIVAVQFDVVVTSALEKVKKFELIF